MKICGIYKITSPSGSIYIGQSVDVSNRICSYRRGKCKQQVRLYNSLKKYGFNNHKFEIICQCDRDQLNNLEVYYINLYDTFNSEFGLNLTSGGGQAKLSEETKSKIGLANKGKKRSIEDIAKRIGRKEDPKATEKRRQKLKGKKLSEETKQKMSESRTGDKHPMFGKKMSEASKEKMRNAKLGKPSHKKGVPLSDEQKEKLRQANLGKKQSDLTKAKRSASLVKAHARRKLKQNTL